MPTLLDSFIRNVRRRLAPSSVTASLPLAPVNLIDVGSAGAPPRPWRDRPDCIHRVLAFEPRDAAGNITNRISLDVALWNANTRRDFYVYAGGNGTGSSLFPQNLDYVRDNFHTLRLRGPRRAAETWFDRSRLVSTQRLDCRRLDDVLADLDPPEPFDFLKIDAQGAEYPILQGAERFLRDHCLGLHLELFVIPLYKDIALLPEVTEHLDALGFDLALQFPPHGTFDSQHDCLFLKRDVDNDAARTIRSVYGLPGTVPIPFGT